jgi:hypothetical protein
MQIRDIQLIKKLPFEKYLELPGLSYSGIKALHNGEFKVTNKMQLGTHLHNYLLEPDTYDYTNANHGLVVQMAKAIKNQLGIAILGMESEVAVTANLEHQGFTMPYKGRIDLMRYGRIIIDLKVSSVPLIKSIPFFGYDRQLTGYAMCTMAKAQMILRVCPSTLRTEIKAVPLDTEWWKVQIVKHGQPLGKEFSIN